MKTKKSKTVKVTNENKAGRPVKVVGKKLAGGYTEVNVGTGGFWDFTKEPVFMGTHTGVKKVMPAKKKGEKPHDVFEFVNDSGTYLLGGYQIKEAVEKYGNKDYRIELLEVKKLKGGRTMKVFSFGVK